MGVAAPCENYIWRCFQAEADLKTKGKFNSDEGSRCVRVSIPFSLLEDTSSSPDNRWNRREYTHATQNQRSSWPTLRLNYKPC